MATPRAATRERNRIAFDKNELSKCAWRDGRGMAVQPRKGDAVLFFSFHRNEETSKFERQDPASTHASCPTSGGVKWTATKWIHERAFVTGVWSAPKCADTLVACEKWAKGGEGATNPGFMIGAVTSARASGAAAATTTTPSPRRRTSRRGDGVLRVVRGHERPRRFAEMRANGGGGSSGARRGGCDDTPTGQALAASRRAQQKGRYK